MLRQFQIHSSILGIGIAVGHSQTVPSLAVLASLLSSVHAS